MVKIMILTGKDILNEIGKNIIIEPFEEEQINPNSYNLRLYNELMIYKEEILDSKKDNKTEIIKIPEEGLILNPGQLYLARTFEYTETYNLVPIIFGRSSIGRLGISVHITSGFGDIGFCGYWTLQLTCIKKVKIYPKMKICQIVYNKISGEYDSYKSQKYQGNKSIISSQIFKEF